MRNYVITKREQKIIRAFLEKSEKLPGFRMLVSRVRRFDLVDFRHQIELIESFLEKIGE